MRATVFHSPASAPAVGLELILNHVDHNLIGYEFSSVHDLFCLLAELCALGDLFSKHVTSSEMADVLVEVLENFGSLSALSGSWRSKEDHSHAL